MVDSPSDCNTQIQNADQSQMEVTLRPDKRLHALGCDALLETVVRLTRSRLVTKFLYPSMKLRNSKSKEEPYFSTRRITSGKMR